MRRLLEPRNWREPVFLQKGELPVSAGVVSFCRHGGEAIPVGTVKLTQLSDATPQGEIYGRR